MSNSLAIAAVTATLRNLLFNELQVDTPDVSVTAMPLDKARAKDATNHQLNLFLLLVNHHGPLRNADFPPNGKQHQGGPPALSLRLNYLLTPYAPGDDDVSSQKLLGKAMSVLHDHPVLGAEEIRTALAGNDLYRQLERVRITPDHLSLEDLSKMWTSFQTQYRLSVIYQVSAVLIESTRTRRVPLPVLGTEGTSQPSRESPFPTLEAVMPPQRQASIRLGDTLLISGANLTGDSVSVVFEHPFWTAPVTLPATSVAPGRIQVVIPQDSVRWPAGTYAVAAVVARTGESPRTTNALPLTLAPRILRLTPNPALQGDITFTVNFEPEAWPGQRVSLLLGSRESLGAPRQNAESTIAFSFTGVEADTHHIRLRVDGVDSLLVDRSTTPPRFDPSQQVVVT